MGDRRGRYDREQNGENNRWSDDKKEDNLSEPNGIIREKIW